MNSEQWGTMKKPAREAWHRAEIEKACLRSNTRSEVRRYMMSLNFGTDLTPYYAASTLYISLPD